MKCLVVDESTTMRRILANAAHDAGCDEVIEAADGADALTRWNAECRVVVTGWLTPEMSGPELVRRLRARPGADGLRVMMVTSRDRAAQVEEAKTAGVDGYLVKPVVPAELTRRLRTWHTSSPAATDEATGAERSGTAPHVSGQTSATTLDRAA